MSFPPRPSGMPYAEVIGDPIAHSRSPLIHSTWLDALGIAARYDHCRVKAEELSEYLTERALDASWRGCNVTMPHKQAIIAHCQRLDPLAKSVGAVNTVVREADGSLTGYNTDVEGFLEPLANDLAQPHLFRMARIIGNGGAARAIVVALAQHHVTLVVAARNQAKARSLLNELAPVGEHHVAPLDHFATPTDFAFDDRENCFDLVVNASPLGMRGQPPLAFDISHAPPGSVVYDIVTDPLETPLLADAKAAGFRTLDGYAMLIGQAVTAFTKFFGAPPPRDDGDTALRGLLIQ